MYAKTLRRNCAENRIPARLCLDHAQAQSPGVPLGELGTSAAILRKSPAGNRPTLSSWGTYT
eukprot:1176423-Prorocentrum_minimum.AAC.2